MICAGEHILSNMLFPLLALCDYRAAEQNGKTGEEANMDDNMKTEQDIDDMIFGPSDGGESQR